MSTDNSTATLRMYVNDMLTLDKHILEAVERQANDDRVKGDPATVALIGEIQGVLTAHVEAFEGHVQALGESAGGMVKQAASHVMGTFAGLYDKLRKDPVSRMLRDDYTALNLAAYSLTMMHTTALAFENSGIAATALSNLQDLTPLIIRLNELAPKVVARELTDEGHVQAGAAAEAVSNTQAAWQK